MLEWLIGLGAAGLVLGMSGYGIWKSLRRSASPAPESRPTPRRLSQAVADDPGALPAAPADELAGAAGRAFGRHAGQFSGLYNVLWQTANPAGLPLPRRRQVLQNWENRLLNTHDPALIQVWSTLMAGSLGRECFRGQPPASEAACTQIARTWLDWLEQWGVRRSPETLLTLSLANEGCYAIYETSYELGARIQVIHPFWTCQEQLVEKGLGVVAE